MKTKSIAVFALLSVASAVNVRFIDDAEDIQRAAVRNEFQVFPQQKRQIIAQLGMRARGDEETKEEKKEESKEEKKEEEKKEEPEETSKADAAKEAKKVAAAEEELIGPAGEKMRLPYGEALARIHGIDKKELQPDRHWTKPWPQGIDDGQDDDKVLHLSPEELKEREKEEKPKYMVVRPAIPGQWPMGKVEDKKGKVIWEYGKIDDGTDDDTVLNAGLSAEGMDVEHFRI